MARETLPMASETQPSKNTAGSADPSNASRQLPGECLSCKIIGSAGFGGLGLYSFYQAQQLPKTLVTRRLGLGLMGTAFIGAAVYRLTMPINQQQPPSEK